MHVIHMNVLCYDLSGNLGEYEQVNCLSYIKVKTSWCSTDYVYKLYL